MTELGKSIKKDAKAKQDSQPINSKKTSVIIWFLIRRHADNLTLVVLSLAIGVMIGVRL
jgi:hypothetical protein